MKTKARKEINCYDYSCFFAFDEKQFKEGKEKAGIKAGEKIYSAGYGLYGTLDGLKKFLAAYK
jgi:hypothetical protein